MVIDLPGVGQNLKDHTRIDVMYGLKRGSLSYLRPNSGWANWAKTQYSALQWLLFGAGDLQCIVSSALSCPLHLTPNFAQGKADY